MIPISRRTIASATCRWRSLGSDSKSRPVELALGGAGAGALGEQGDEQRQHAVEVVQAVGGSWPSSEQDRAEQRPGATTARLGGAQQVPEARPRAGRRSQAIAAPDAGGEVGRRGRATPTTRWTVGHRPYPPRRVGIPLADAENHYVASLSQSGYITRACSAAELPPGPRLRRPRPRSSAAPWRCSTTCSARSAARARGRRASRTSAGCRPRSRAPSASGSASTWSRCSSSSSTSRSSSSIRSG